jgi:EF hand
VHRLPLTALAAALAALSLAACAGGPRGGGPGGPGGSLRIEQSAAVAPEALIFLEFDTDRDRTISSAELRAGLEADWAQASKGAASIGHIDLRAWLVSVLGSDEFDFGPVGFDTNLDSVITKAEFTSALTQRFTVLDLDKNGALSRKELIRRVESLGRGQVVRPGSEGGGPPGGGGRPPQ